MTGQRRFRHVVPVVVALAAGLAGCGPRPVAGPQRVPADGAPCSAVMPGPAASGEGSIRLENVAVTEHSWVRLPPGGTTEPAADVRRYAVRRGVVPAGAALRDGALLDAAAARVGRGIALENETKATVAKVSTPAGEAVELRWTTGTLHSATRLLLIPGGYCEVTIAGARAEADITSYFASVQVSPAGAN